MKKIYSFLFTVLLLAGTAKAQNIYNFSHSTATYTPLSSPVILVNTAAGFNGSYQSVALGFSFQYWQVPYTTFYFTTDAYCLFTPGNYGFFPFYSPLKSLGNSQIGYQITGTTPNRIVKAEWKHVGFINDASSTDSASFQVWLYETSNVVEIHF